jgi:hypothetical protein
MSFYTKFQDVESVLTASSTATLGATDVVLGFSYTDNKPHQVPIASISPFGGITTATTNSTATTISNQGLTLLKSTGGSSCSWLLADPTQTGQLKMLVFASSTTSTLYAVAPVAASIESSASFSGTLINFASTATGAMINAGNSVTLVSLTSTSWLVIGRNMNATQVSSFTFAVGFGPTFT